jgi:hypothetical protein
MMTGTGAPGKRGDDLPAVGVSHDGGPRRANRIGVTICEIISASGGELQVRGPAAVRPFRLAALSARKPRNDLRLSWSRQGPDAADAGPGRVLSILQGLWSTVSRWRAGAS